MACVSGRTYFAMSSLRSAKTSRKGRVSRLGADSSRERHFIKHWSVASKSSLRLATVLLHPRHLHPCQPSGEAGLAHLLEHFFHLRVLAQKVVHFLHAGA